jgi:hypothetical protein
VAAALGAAALLAAVQAGAGTPASVPSTGHTGAAMTGPLHSTGSSTSVHYVSGYAIHGNMRGSLKGALAWTGPNRGFDAFLASMKYNQANGVMTFRVPASFKGSIAGVGKGTLTVVGASVQVVKPGTPLYDFSTFPSNQPGTTGDPKLWLAGWTVNTITSGTGAFKGASGTIYLRDIRALTDASYWGVVRLKSAA